MKQMEKVSLLMVTKGHQSQSEAFGYLLLILALYNFNTCSVGIFFQRGFSFQSWFHKPEQLTRRIPIKCKLPDCGTLLCRIDDDNDDVSCVKELNVT